jgi:hypothetical protein
MALFYLYSFPEALALSIVGTRAVRSVLTCKKSNALKLERGLRVLTSELVRYH